MVIDVTDLDGEPSSQGDRMKNERVRLGLTPLQAGKLLLMSARKYLEFELRHADLPKSHQLLQLAEHGFNVQYILTGQGAGPVGLTPEEWSLIENYRASSPQRRSSCRRAANSAFSWACAQACRCCASQPRQARPTTRGMARLPVR